jgi:serine O-acetyltransferase
MSINNKSNYKYYLKADQLALGKEGQKTPKLFTDEIWRFQILLRKIEYFSTKKNFFWKFYFTYLKLRFNHLSIKLGFEIPPNVFGPGLSIAHRGSIIINPGAHIGNNCRIHVGVNIGTQAGTTSKVPRIGNNVYIGPGVKIFGEIEIGDDVAIGANAVVNKSFRQTKITIAGVPAKKISDNGSIGLLVRATELL